MSWPAPRRCRRRHGSAFRAATARPRPAAARYARAAAALCARTARLTRPACRHGAARQPPSGVRPSGRAGPAWGGRSTPPPAGDRARGRRSKDRRQLRGWDRTFGGCALGRGDWVGGEKPRCPRPSGAAHISVTQTPARKSTPDPNPALDILPVPAFLRRLPCRGVAQLARAPVSKTGGWGFETLHPCQRAFQKRARRVY